MVDEKPTYDDWANVEGFSFAGEYSIFPHMSDEWEDLIKEKKKANPELYSSVVALRENEGLSVNGEEKVVTKISSEKE